MRLAAQAAQQPPPRLADLHRRPPWHQSRSLFADTLTRPAIVHIAQIARAIAPALKAGAALPGAALSARATPLAREAGTTLHAADSETLNPEDLLDAVDEAGVGVHAHSVGGPQRAGQVRPAAAGGALQGAAADGAQAARRRRPQPCMRCCTNFWASE